MKRWTFTRLAKLGTAASLAAGLGLGFGFGSVSSARTASDTAVSAVEPGAALEAVESFSMLTRPHSWTPIDEDTVILWATPFRPYLVELAFPSHDLRFSEVIGVTSVGSRVYAKFDSVKVGGFRYPIDSIYKLTREEAKNWSRGS